MIATVQIHQFANGYVVGATSDPDKFDYNRNEVCFVEKVVSQ